MAFEVFDKRLTPLAKAPTVTIQMRGIITLNRAAYALMNEPSTVELLYDKEQDVIGIREVSDDTPHGYSVRPQNANKDSGPLVIAGTAFTQYYSIDTSTSRRWTPELRDGVLCIDVRRGGVEVRGNRRRADESSGDE